MSRTSADLIAETLTHAGVKRIYGVVGDSLNGLSDALRRHKSIDWVHVRHEEGAAFAAGGEAHVTGKLAVCAGSCGPGNLHLINGLFDCQRNGVPVLAIAAHIPSSQIGSDYFQATHPEKLFQECSHFVELISNPEHLPQILNRAIRVAIGKRGVAVIVLPGDIALKPATADVAPWLVPEAPLVVPQKSEIAKLASLLNEGQRTTLFCGAGCAGARDEVLELARRLKAPIVHALRGKEHVEYDNPYDVGMTGLLGVSSGFAAMRACDTLLILGSDFPYRQFFPAQARTAQVDLRVEALGNRCPLELGLIGDVKETLALLNPLVEEKSDGTHLQEALAHYAQTRRSLNALSAPTPGGKHIHPQQVTKVVSDLAADDAIVTADVGTPTAWIARYFEVNGRRRIVGSFSHGSMANAMLQAIGIQKAFPGRQVISMSGDGGFTMMMGEFVTLLQTKLPVKIVVLNNGTLGFVELEMKANGFPDVGCDLINPNFAAMAEAMGIRGFRVERPDDLEGAVRSALLHSGPALVDVVTARQELVMPPAINIEEAKNFSLFMAKAVLDGRLGELIDLADVNLRR